MSEAQPTPNPQAAPASEPEPQLPDNWDQLFSTDTPPPAPPEEAEAPAAADADTESAASAPPSDAERAAQAEAEVEKWRTWGTNYLRQVQATQAGATASASAPAPADPIEQALEKVKAQYTGVDDNVMTFMRDLFKEVLPAVTEPVRKEVGDLRQAQANLHSQGVLEKFEQDLDTMFAQKKLPKSLHRAFKNDILMEGYRRYGNAFDETKAARLFNEQYSQYAKETHQKNNEYVTTKIEREANAPPTTQRGTGQHAAEDIHRQIITSKDKKNDFGGSNFSKMVRAKLAKLANQQ